MVIGGTLDTLLLSTAWHVWSADMYTQSLLGMT